MEKQTGCFAFSAQKPMNGHEENRNGTARNLHHQNTILQEFGMHKPFGINPCICGKGKEHGWPTRMKTRNHSSLPIRHASHINKKQHRPSPDLLTRSGNRPSYRLMTEVNLPQNMCIRLPQKVYIHGTNDQTRQV